MIRALVLCFLLQEPALKLPSASADPYRGPENLNFESGETGRIPAEWSIVQDARVAGYTLERRAQGCHTGAGCAVLSGGSKTEKSATGAIAQEFDAEPYQGKHMRLRAWVKLEGGGRGDAIRVAFTTAGEHGEANFTQKGRGTDSTEWAIAEVEGKVPFHAEQIQILIALKGKGKAWIDDITFEPAP
jgi:hypothetical protein